ncbi:hypothetical protein [Mycobacterium sp. NPDC006124]|uniref:hypothetical protein n=1 Tax=Mycobacterium sp. NPDC006124 TaxID=3156729 RepID=UPI0033B3EF49
MQRSQLYQRFLAGSLREHDDLARGLFGAHGAPMVRRWLDGELAKVDDPAYARLFTDHVDLPGVAPGDYAHRVVETSHGALLGGIRFYGRDVGRPFVEVVAPDFEDLDALRQCEQPRLATDGAASRAGARPRGRLSCYCPDIPSSFSALP